VNFVGYKKFSDYPQRLSEPQDVAKILFENQECNNSYYITYADLKRMMADGAINRIANKSEATTLDEGANKISIYIYNESNQFLESKVMTIADFKNKFLKNSYGNISFINYTTPSTISISTIDTDYLLSSVCDTTDVVSGLTFLSGAYTIINDGDYFYSISISFDIDGVDVEEEFQLSIYKNGSLLKEDIRFNAIDKLDNINISGYASLTSSDTIDVRIKCKSIGTVSFNIYHCNFEINKMN
jgi:hypothetical protein